MEIDLELQEKEVFREVVVDGEYETIAIWLDGDWSIMSSTHYEEKLQEGFSPIYFINRDDLTSEVATTDQVEELIRMIELMLNVSIDTARDHTI